ncbi:Protein lin-9 [Clonorchis sinensis]|uniref:Protein lin-9 n=1 Tax=Clonorchis sinensis TaxID=79923 RepID=A0A8T1MT95_CLOSI|nr:Protein lin-9 [Clonorchis sinensis]
MAKPQTEDVSASSHPSPVLRDGTSDEASQSTSCLANKMRQLCNMFKTNKFCDWLGYEWLYSIIDREIFLGPNDFQLILREHFPTLKTRNLRRSHWGIIRRMIGRPRRFSATFLAEERQSVQGKRRNLQYLQQIASTGSLGPMASEHLDSLLNCLPLNTRIPPRLPIGTKLCVRLYSPVQGLFLGVVQESYQTNRHYAVWVTDMIHSVDPNNHTAADFSGLQIVADEDAFPLPNQPLPQSLSLSSIRYHFKNNVSEKSRSSFTSNYQLSGQYNPNPLCDVTNIRPEYENRPTSTSIGPLLSESVCPGEHSLGPNNPTADDSLMISNMKHTSSETAGCPLNVPLPHVPDAQPSTSLLTSLAKICRLLEQKRTSVATLREMNNLAEVKLSEDLNSLTVQFQHSYATLILHLNKLNQDLKYHMDIVLMHVATIPVPTTPYVLSTYDGEIFEAVPVSGASSEYGYVTVVPTQLTDTGTAGMTDGLSSHHGPEQSDRAYGSTDIPKSFYDGQFDASCNDPYGQIAQERNLMQLKHLTDWRRRCDDEAQEMVSRIRLYQHRPILDDCRVDLVAKLSSLLIHLCNLSDQRMMNQSLTCIDDILREIRAYLHPNNLKCFEVTVEHLIGQIIHAVTSPHPINFPASYPSNQTLPQGMYSENLACM